MVPKVIAECLLRGHPMVLAMDPYCWEFRNVFSKRTTMVHRICAQVGDRKWNTLVEHLIWW